jgi:23S rRNA G2445 N2-methylase RlmL
VLVSHTCFSSCADHHDSSSASRSWGRIESNEQPLETVAETAMCIPKRYKFRKFSVKTRLPHGNGIKNQSSVSTSISNAIWDALRDACGGQWPEPPERDIEVGVPLVLHLNRDTAILYRDMSGVSLHELGYGDSIDKAKSKEGLAAAILTIAGWNHMVPGFGDANKNAPTQDRVLLDPFCGTGTILIQAALMACNVAPGLLRRQWPFQVCGVPNFKS